jgi:transaldolase
VAAARSAQRDDQGPRHPGGPVGDRGVDPSRREHRRNGAGLDRALRAGDRRLPARTHRPSASGPPLDQIHSVASFFLSRIDTQVDKHLAVGSPVCGQVAIASARVAYQRYPSKFAGDAWERLEALGATRQRPLWASTGTKNPDYADTRYVADLVGPDVVNTMPEHTLHAFADHGEVESTLDADPDAAERTLAGAARFGIDIGAVTAELEREGVRSFCDSYQPLLDCIEGKLGTIAPA